MERRLQKAGPLSKGCGGVPALDPGAERGMKGDIAKLGCGSVDDIVLRSMPGFNGQAMDV